MWRWRRTGLGNSIYIDKECTNTSRPHNVFQYVDACHSITVSNVCITYLGSTAEQTKPSMHRLH